VPSSEIVINGILTDGACASFMPVPSQKMSNLNKRSHNKISDILLFDFHAVAVYPNENNAVIMMTEIKS